MDWTELVEKLGDRSRAVPASEFSADDPGASHCGVYTWWADETAQHVIKRALGADASSVIYVGKAGGGMSSQTLATRIVGKHLKSRANIGSSTLRKSLTAILMKDKAFAAEHTSPDAVVRSPILSDWMRQHLKVAIAPVDRPEQVKHAEEAALKYYDPPLNLQGVTTTPARAQLSTLRKALPGRRRAGR